MSIENNYVNILISAIEPDHLLVQQQHKPCPSNSKMNNVKVGKQCCVKIY